MPCTHQRRKKMWKLLWVVLLAAGSSVLGDDVELRDYCSVNKFENLPAGLRFAKEVAGKEYASVGSFKALHCCLRGYRSIEWYKDSRPYPWPDKESKFIIYPENKNQTIYTQEVKSTDAGRYSCLGRNETDSVEGDITLIVINESRNGYKGVPLTTYRPSSQLVPLGGTARLFCEAYIGKAYVPDARTSVYWRKSVRNDSISHKGRVSQTRVSREDNQIVGSYLVIEDITMEDYGEYVCQINNGVEGDNVKMFAHLYRQEPKLQVAPTTGSWHKTLLLSVLVLVLLCSAAAFWIRCWLPVALFLRDKLGSIDENDGKEVDALVCYHEKDSGVVVNVIMPNLETRYRYRCQPLELSNLRQHWSLEISPHAGSARRVIIVLSPDSLTWSDPFFSQTLKQLSTLQSRTIIICLREPPCSPSTIKCSVRGRVSRDPGATVDLSGLETLCWHGPENRHFWLRLRYAMPPMRRPSKLEAQAQNVAMIVQQSNNNVQNARSRESLEVLV